jgi:hypothetical protein
MVDHPTNTEIDPAVERTIAKLRMSSSVKVPEKNTHNKFTLYEPFMPPLRTAAKPL